MSEASLFRPRVANMRLVKEGLGVSIKKICVESGMFVIVLDELVSCLKHEDGVLLRRNVAT